MDPRTFFYELLADDRNNNTEVVVTCGAVAIITVGNILLAGHSETSRCSFRVCYPYHRLEIILTILLGHGRCVMWN